MAKPAYNARDHQRGRQRLLEDGTGICVHCDREIGWDGKPLVRDHVPPLSLHEHVEGTGCCYGVESCTTCSVKQGAAISKLVGKMGATEVVFEEPVPSPHPGDSVWDAIPWIEELRDVPDNATWPRWMTPPHPLAIGTYGDDFVTYCREQWGTELRWFQRLIAARLFEFDVEGRLVWRKALWSMARQLGKSWHLRLAAMHFAQEMERYCPSASVDTHVMICSRRLIAAEMLMDSTIRWVLDTGHGFGWSVGRSKGQKHIELPNGRQVRPRSLDSTFGATNGCIIGDEVWSIDAEQWNDGAAMTTAAVGGVQWFTSTANARASTFALNLRSDAFADFDDPHRMLLIEWGSDRLRARDDRDGWREASPHWDRDREDLIADWFRSAERGVTVEKGEDPWRAFDANVRNIWPVRQARRGRGEELVSTSEWASALRAGAEPVQHRVVAVEDDYGRNLSVVVTGLSESGNVVLDGRRFTSKAEGWEYVRSLPNVEQYLVGVSLMSDPNVRDLAPVSQAGSTETRRGMSVLRSLVESDSLRHTGAPDLAEQMLAARVRTGPAGLSIVSIVDAGLVRAAVWAVEEAHRRDGIVVGVW